MLDRPVPARASHARKLILSGTIPVVPLLWRHEVSNGLVIGERRSRLTSEQLKTLTQDLDEFCETVQVDPLIPPASVLIQLARNTNLTVYDAAYVELAARRRLPLATLDDKLREAARHAGLALI
jgi:predicted nucleic acid-binding protein